MMAFELKKRYGKLRVSYGVIGTIEQALIYLPKSEYRDVVVWRDPEEPCSQKEAAIGWNRETKTDPAQTLLMADALRLAVQIAAAMDAGEVRKQFGPKE